MQCSKENKRVEGITIILRTEQLSKSIEQQLIYLAFTLDVRGKLSLFDLHKYCEDFSKNLLNLMYGYRLENLNEQNFNEPGMDLGDRVNEVAIQVTTNKTSLKINETLEKITPVQKESYKKFIVLILGTKQKRYTIKSHLASPVNFTEDNIWDIIDLLQRINSLTALQMKKVDDFLKDEIINVYRGIESEEGSGLLKETQTLIFTNCKAMVQYQESMADWLEINEEEEKEMEEEIRALMNVLSSLPPVTIEFFYALVVKSEYIGKFDEMRVDYDVMKRFVKLTEKEYCEELDILKANDLISFDTDFDDKTTICLSSRRRKSTALNNITDFVKAKNIDLEDVLVKFDLSSFAIE
ncbi:SMEK domain-containing protein [Bacillus mycoides]|uniref:SMEK domain-containing protein n=1 Tax=Bacillus mycoides TaxID=1405 RepID=UPI00065B6F82|nr:SMEK domain-containing protein [Bacillus mycoides]KMQ18029.1 hypothetical protein TU70_11605 [Bacillus mycoides]